MKEDSKEQDEVMSMNSTKEEPIPIPPDDIPSLREQNLRLPADIRQRKASPKDVIVLAFGSYAIRYGFASDSTPNIVFPAVAFPRRDTSVPPYRVPRFIESDSEKRRNMMTRFEDIRGEIADELTLSERRRGGGRPTPWKASVEIVQPPGSRSERTERPSGSVLVGHDVELLLLDEDRAKSYDIVFPMWDGKLLFDCEAPASLIQKALEALLHHIVEQLKHDRRHGKGKGAKGKPVNQELDGESVPDNLFSDDGYAKTFVTLVLPESSQRRDAAELVQAVFESRAMQTAAVFIHQSAVSCALGAGLATCAVVDIGHSATTIACVEDGVVCGESRIHLDYGSVHVQQALDINLRDYSHLYDIVSGDRNRDPRSSSDIHRDWKYIVAKAAEQMVGFNVDENDTMKVAVIKAPSGLTLRIKLGVGICAVPCYGLIIPDLLQTAKQLSGPQRSMPHRGVFERNSQDDNFVSDIFNDLRRSGIATAALPIGIFANDSDQPASATVHAQRASLVDAIIWSIARAVEIKRPDQQSRTADHYRRYLNAIVLAGGGASIDGIALALESRIKKGFIDAGVAVSDVTVIDGGKGKGDEELAAAAAVLKDVESEGGIIDDTDTASLPWKGGAVMVEADAVSEYWVYRDDWDSRNVRALRERVPFYW